MATVIQPLLVAIGGFDPSGGAGVVRDFLTARTFGAAVRLIPTAWTEQGAGGVQGIESRPPAALAAAIKDALRGAAEATARCPPSTQVGTGATPGGQPATAGIAIKIGMLPDEAAVAAVMQALGDFAGPVILDPVLAASSGGALFRGDVGALVALGARATLVTPNAPEAAALTGLPVANLAEAIAAGIALGSRGIAAVLVKGGHLDGGGEAVDVLVRAGRAHQFRLPRVNAPVVRGTGCALATAISVGLARGLPLEQAVTDAKLWLADALTRAVAVGDAWHLP